MQMLFQNRNIIVIAATNNQDKKQTLVQSNNTNLFFSRNQNEKSKKYDMFKSITTDSGKCSNCGH